MKLIRTLALAAALLAPTGCVTGDLHEGYVQQDRATLDAFKRRIPEWIDNSDLSSEKKDDYRGLLHSWEARVEAAERDIQARQQEDSGE